jgi:hypothetical protein
MRGPFARSVTAEKNRPPLPLRAAQPSVNQGRIFTSGTHGRSVASLSNGANPRPGERRADAPRSSANGRYDAAPTQPRDEFLWGRKRTPNVAGGLRMPPADRNVRRACCRSATLWHGELAIHTELDAPPAPIGDHALLDHVEDAAERCARCRAHLDSHVAAGDRHRIGCDHARGGESPTRCRATQTRGGRFGARRVLLQRRDRYALRNVMAPAAAWTSKSAPRRFGTIKHWSRSTKTASWESRKPHGRADNQTRAGAGRCRFRLHLRCTAANTVKRAALSAF